jgi:hypothetical protein
MHSRPAVADRPPRRVDAAVERRVGHDPPLPYGRNEIVLAHHPLAVVDQIRKQVEHLRLDRHELIFAAELAPLAIECKICEQIQQFAGPTGAMTEPQPYHSRAGQNKGRLKEK